MQQSDPDIKPYSSAPAEIQRLLDARHPDPFSVLGRHVLNNRETIRAIMPRAAWVRIAESGVSLDRIANTDLFEWQGQTGSLPRRYRLIWEDGYGVEHIAYDPYCFPPQISDFDMLKRISESIPIDCLAIDTC